MNIKKSGVFIFAACWLGLCVLGCGGGKSGSRSGLAKAGGVVTYNGSPVENAVLEFRPSDGATNSMAVGRTDAAGKFTLMTDRPGDGAVPGKYKVVVKKQEQTIDGIPRSEWEKQNGGDEKGERPEIDKSKLKTENLLPEPYADPINTPLEIEIPAGGNKKIAIDLKD